MAKRATRVTGEVAAAAPTAAPAVTATAAVPLELTAAVAQATSSPLPVVASAAGAVAVESEVVRLKALKTELTKRFDGIKKPFNAALKQLRQFESDLVGAVDARLTSMSDALVGWRQAERARLAAAAEAEAEAERQRAAEALRRASAEAPSPEARQTLAQQAEAVAAAPVYAPAPAVSPLSELVEVTRWEAELSDARALVLAAAATEMLAVLDATGFVAGSHTAYVHRFLTAVRGAVPVPLDAVAPDGPVLNRYARELKEQMDWPGVRSVSRTSLARR